MKLNINLLDNKDQTRQCEKLLAAVVATAIRDLSIAPVKTTGKPDPNKRGHPSEIMRLNGINQHAFSAARFLFGKNGGLSAYLHWLDMNPKSFRQHLLDVMWNDSPVVVGGFDSQARRAMKANYLRWMDLQWIDQPEGDDDE